MSLVASDVTVALQGCAIVHKAALSLSRGECVGLLGPNGAGKSTLLRAILGLVPAPGALITLEGKAPVQLGRKAFARRVAYLPQGRHVEWQLTARDVVALGRHPHADGPGEAGIIEACLQKVDAAGLAGRAFDVLSGGEKARVLLARALAVQSDYLLADEPTAGLDPYHQLHVMELLRALARDGKGVLVVLHDLSLAARFMDRVILMSRGEVIDAGLPGDVLTPARLAEVYSVTALAGQQDGAGWLMPWERVARPGSPA